MSSGWGRATRTGSTARRRRRWPRCSRCCLPRWMTTAFEPADRRRSARSPARAIWAARSAATARRSARIDIALHDLAGKVLGLPVARAPRAVGRSAADRLHDRHRRTSRRRRARCGAPPTFPALKIKCGGPADLATLRAVREVFAGPIRVDANTGWTRADAESLLPALVDLGVELIEQPFPARAYRDLGWLQELSPMPIVADESCVFPEDLEALVGVVAGVNVKLAKCGGIGPARQMLERARELGFRTFLGCMEETSVGIAASAVVGVARRVGRSRRQPAAGRRPVRGPGARHGQALAPVRTAGPGSRSARSCGRLLKIVTILGTPPIEPVGPPALMSTAAAEPVQARSARMFGERPFVWTSWWTKSWTSPLPTWRRCAYDVGIPAAERTQGGSAGTPGKSGPTVRRRVD